MKKFTESIIEILAKRQKVSRTKIISKYGPVLEVVDAQAIVANSKARAEAQDPVVHAENLKPAESFTQPTTFETVAGRTGFVAMLQADLHYKSGLVQQKEKELDALLEAKRAEIRDLEAEVSMLRARVDLTERTPIKGMGYGMDLVHCGRKF